MIEGELFEYSMAGNLDIHEDQYLEIIQKKTASLFSTTSQIAGVLGEIPFEKEEELTRFGLNFGMSFQIIDDLLDYTGEVRSLGKPILSDLNEGRITLPLIYTLSNGSRANRKIIAEFLKDKSASNRSRVIDLVKSNGALEYTFNKAEEFSDLSKKNLDKFPDSLHRQALSSLTDYVLLRNK
jgi:octaprenyl-diphosphate synthase